MPGPPLINTFIGGSDTTVITTANSGGPSGQECNANPGALATFSKTHAVDPSTLSMQIAQGATFADTQFTWVKLGQLAAVDVWGRQYLYITANPPTTAMNLILLRDQASAGAGGFRITTSGFVTGLSAAGGQIATGSVALATNQWVRIEWRCRQSTTAGVAQLQWWLWNSAFSTDAPSDTAQDTSTALGANLDEIRWGNPSNGPINYTSWHSHLSCSLAGPISIFDPTKEAPLPRQMPTGC